MKAQHAHSITWTATMRSIVLILRKVRVGERECEKERVCVCLRVVKRRVPLTWLETSRLGPFYSLARQTFSCHVAHERRVME